MFYKKYVDIASVKSMWEFLREHPTYSTLNSWNGLRSVAHNVKLYNLKLEGDWSVALQFLYDPADSGCLQLLINDFIRDWERDHKGYKVGFNGRSNGYLVLYNEDNYRSILPPCVEDYESYEEFKEDVTGPYNGYKVSDFFRELRDTVLIVRDFDRLCDDLRDLVNEYSKKSFDTAKLAEAVEQFNASFGDDLEELGLEGPEAEDDYVNLHDISNFNAFMTCFYNCLGEDSKRSYVNGNLLYLKEM
jgi:hypothetical protein